jgi:hypothetical protein
VRRLSSKCGSRHLTVEAPMACYRDNLTFFSFFSSFPFPPPLLCVILQWCLYPAYIESIDGITDEFWRRQSWSNRYIPPQFVWMDGGNTRKVLISITGTPASSRNEHLPNTRPDDWRLKNLLIHSNFIYKNLHDLTPQRHAVAIPWIKLSQLIHTYIHTYIHCKVK